ncbi:MAG TPA: exodeoxyribonuclease VII large subunit [Methanomicrobia archaeon]|nr:exodeoxyribonuclease VII large subunit [Methanomicrobia archaeon]
MAKPHKVSGNLLDFLYTRDDKPQAVCHPENARVLERVLEVDEKVNSVGGVKEPRIYTVQEITGRIRHILEDDKELRDIYVKGELSNLSQPTSGHQYFTLKDEYAEIPCVMFKDNSRGLKFGLEDGMSVIARGRISVYEKRGKYQLSVTELQEAGLGALYLAFEQLKKRLKAEGLFDPAYKKPIPSFPRRIGLVTSPSGAAVRDMLKVTKKRFPHVHILLAPVAVQGEGASLQIAHAIRMMNRCSMDRERIDVLIVGRGGGSLEELWAFNEECVARAIFASKIPVISAVGHETDFTIADFVADKRAATPSEAAEIVVPDAKELARNLRSLELQLRQNVYKGLEFYRKRLEATEKNLLFRTPKERINQHRQTIDELKRAMVAELRHLTSLHRKSVLAFAGRLEALSPLAILDRGYSICTKVPEGTLVRSVDELAVGDALKILFADGEAVSDVKSKKRTKAPEPP